MSKQFVDTLQVRTNPEQGHTFPPLIPSELANRDMNDMDCSRKHPNFCVGLERMDLCTLSKTRRGSADQILRADNLADDGEHNSKSTTDIDLLSSFGRRATFLKAGLSSFGRGVSFLKAGQGDNFQMQ